MSKLYIAPGACSFASHVLVNELKLPIEIVAVSLTDPQAAHRQISPFGRVPALVLEDGNLLTENTAILPYLADLRPNTTLFAPPYTLERSLIQSWLGYLSSEVHAASFRVINRPQRFHDDVEQHAHIQQKGQQLLLAALQPIVTHLQHHTWLVSERFTIADIYLGVFLGWIQSRSNLLEISPVLSDYLTRYNERESVKATRTIEALNQVN